MSEIKVDTLSTVSGSGNITVSNNIAGAGTISGTNLTASGTLAVTGNTTFGGTLVNTGLITASAGVAIGGTGAVNTIDDYEEGTFTPVLTFGGGTTGITYSGGRQLGQYTKIGDTVHIYIHIQLTSKGSSTGAAQITGLPFTVKNSGHHYIPAKVWIQSMASLNETPTFRFMTGATVMDSYQMSNNTYSIITHANCNGTFAAQISGQYFI